jgi:hypothetical protein
MLVFLMVTQKTNTTKSTIKAYSTSPWPSSSTMSLFKSCIYSPPLLWGGNAREVPGKRGTPLFGLLPEKHQNNFAAGGQKHLDHLAVNPKGHRGFDWLVLVSNYTPKIAINAFVQIFGPYIEVVDKDYQLVVRKKKDLEKIDLDTYKPIRSLIIGIQRPLG